LRLIFRGVPHLIVEVIAGIVASVFMAVIAAISGVSVDELLARFGNWVIAQGPLCAAYFAEIITQIGALFIS